MNIITVKGIIIEGYRVASGPSSGYPYGTLEKQKPYFKALGLDLENVYNGTLNVSIHPHTFEMANPEFIFERLTWTELHPPETFSFSRCGVVFAGKRYDGWVYYPHPETKERHFQQPSMIEILTEFIPGVLYGAEITLELNRDEIQVIFDRTNIQMDPNRELLNKLYEENLWDIRAFVYRHFAETTRAPSVDETAAAFALTPEVAASVYQALNDRHAFFLEPGTHEIRMANPFSNLKTPFRVHANWKTYYANCAWDSLGIPAALHCDAQVEAVCAQSGEKIELRVQGGQVSASDALVHFLVPFARWYDDLVFT